jgi:hypothetical protein
VAEYAVFPDIPKPVGTVLGDLRVLIRVVNNRDTGDRPKCLLHPVIADMAGNGLRGDRTDLNADTLNKVPREVDQILMASVGREEFPYD